MTSIVPISKERGQRKAMVAQLFWQNQRFHTLCDEKKSPNYSLKHNYIARIAKSPLNVPVTTTTEEYYLQTKLPRTRQMVKKTGQLYED